MRLLGLDLGGRQIRKGLAQQYFKGRNWVMVRLISPPKARPLKSGQKLRTSQLGNSLNKHVSETMR